MDESIVLLDWYMPREELKDRVQWLSQPLYMNSKFFDRYIEIKVPSTLDLAKNGRDVDYVGEILEDGRTLFARGGIDSDSNVLIEFATVQPEQVQYVQDTTSPYECEFVTDKP